MKTLKCCIQSSSFMGLTPLTTMTTFCTIRALSDRFYFYRQLLIPTLLGSLVGVSCDFPARRETVAIFALQICTEIIWRTLVEEGKVSPIKNGSTYLFAISSMLAMYLYTKYPDKDGGIVGTILSFLTGSATKETLPKKVASKYQKSKDHNNNIQNQAKHPVCEHAQRSCIKNVLVGGMVTFSGIIAIQVIVSSLSNLKNISFESIKRQITSERVLRMSLFGSSYVAIYRAANCIMNNLFLSNKFAANSLSANISNKNSNQLIRDRIKIISSGLASFSMMINPSSSISLWLFWKSVHSFLSIELFKGDRPSIDKFNFILKVFLVSHIMYSGFFNAGNMRPSYATFMGNMSGGRLFHLNRRPLAAFGVKEYKQEMVPQLDPSHCSEEYIKDYLEKIN